MSQITFGSCEVVKFDPLFLHLNLPCRATPQDAADAGAESSDAAAKARQRRLSSCSESTDKKSILKRTGRTQSFEDCKVPLEPGLRGMHMDFFYRMFKFEDKEGILDHFQETLQAKEDDLEGFEAGDCGSGDLVYTPCQKKSSELLQDQLEGIENEDGFRSYDAMFDFNNDDYYVDGGEIYCVDYDFA
jgi:hypothetical protein